ISALLRALCGAEAALVVNNCAAAVLLTLAALTTGREVVVSRGEAIEIGGGFRIPEVLQQSGARLVEVGTTNRTYVRDYVAASSATTAAWLKVHPSNFQIAGFTHVPTTAELRRSASELGVLLLEDLGSGALLETERFGLTPEPTFGAALAAGADLVMASGDKLLGGPQAGIIAGRAELVQRVGAHPLARAVRADKTTLAGVAQTLRHYARGEAADRIPVWRMIAAPASALRDRAMIVVERLQQERVACDVASTTATVGGGSVPGATLPSWGIALTPTAGDTADDLARRLRTGQAPQGVFGRIDTGRVLLDMRTVLPEDDDALVEAVLAAWQ
ncbi:MAG: L-seryl-tRNA(Sec) selenium transferase, partial [Thermomicrobiales bacterium]